MKKIFLIAIIASILTQEASSPRLLSPSKQPLKSPFDKLRNLLRQAQKPSFYDSGTPYTVAEPVEATSQIALRQTQEPPSINSGTVLQESH